MEFQEDEQEDHEEEEEEEEGEEEEEDEEEGEMGSAAVSYDDSQLANSNPNRLGDQLASAAAQNKAIRYKECRKNHAVGMGGHAVDGCLEFMASGAEGTLNALKCAACNCHRNFHRKENYSNYPVAVFPPPQPIYRDPPPPLWYPLRVGPTQQHPRPLGLPSPAVVDVQEEAGAGWNVIDNVGGGGSGPSGNGSGSSSRKRFRTKFSQDQKERMLGLAEKLGWRIQKHDEAEVERFCSETGVKRQVLKVWMHNNKHTLGKKP